MNFSDFDTIIDARTPSEFAKDHIPGAISAPVLYDVERAEVGTLYKQVSAFEAKKVGGALVAKNVARHIEKPPLRRRRHQRLDGVLELIDGNGIEQIAGRRHAGEVLVEKSRRQSRVHIALLELDRHAVVLVDEHQMIEEL